MNKLHFVTTILLNTLLILMSVTSSPAQEFDFDKLENQIHDYGVIMELRIEFSFGMHNTEQTSRLLGTIVSEDGLIIFDGTTLSSDVTFSSIARMAVKSTPTRIEVTTLDGEEYLAELVGVDRFTRIGFARITNAERSFKPITFKATRTLQVGEWFTLFTLLPDFVSPPLSTDIGMLSGIITSPEHFPLMVGFGRSEINSVIYDRNLEPVGVLGTLMDPSAASADRNGMLESFRPYGSAPLLGLITADRLTALITDPPRKGEVDRGWLGITLQALTPEIASFWGISVPGGIIVNDIVTGSPAENGGLVVGDIVYQINGEQVEVDKEDQIPIFQRGIAEMGPGTSVELAVLRPIDQGIDSQIVLVTLGDAPIAATEADDFESEQIEMKVRNMVFGDYLRNQLDQQTFRGVVVSELKQGGLAAVGGLKIGDFIQRIGSTEVSDVVDAEAAFVSLEEERPSEIIFFVWRDNKTLFVNVKTDWQ